VACDTRARFTAYQVVVRHAPAVAVKFGAGLEPENEALPVRRDQEHQVVCFEWRQQICSASDVSIIEKGRPTPVGGRV
jgi:hypothetical protein